MQNEHSTVASPLPRPAENGSKGQRLEGLFSRLKRVPIFGVTGKPELGGDASHTNGVGDEAEVAGGLFSIAKSADFWFAISASQIETTASELAQSTAAANLPRIEVKYETCEEENALANQC